MIVAVDAIACDGGHGGAPGKNFAVRLERHGVDGRVNNVDRMGRTEAGAITDNAAAFDANLIVMGGCRRTRAQEWLMGGVTHEFTQSARTPLFLSH